MSRMNRRATDPRSVLVHGRTIFFVCVVALLSALWPAQSHAVPIINSISSISDQSLQTIDIFGSGFGTLAPYTGNSNHIYFADLPKFSAGYSGPACCGATIPINDVYSLIVNSWTDSKVELGGILYNGAGGTFGTLANGDPVRVFVFNAQTNSGPAQIDCIVGGTACTNAVTTGVPEPSALLLFGTGLFALVLVGRRRQRGRS